MSSGFDGPDFDPSRLGDWIGNAILWAIILGMLGMIPVALVCEGTGQTTCNRAFGIDVVAAPLVAALLNYRWYMQETGRWKRRRRRDYDPRTTIRTEREYLSLFGGEPLDAVEQADVLTRPEPCPPLAHLWKYNRPGWERCAVCSMERRG